MLLGEPNGFTPVTRLGDYLPIGALFEHLSQALPHDGVVIRKQNTKGLHTRFPASLGSCGFTGPRPFFSTTRSISAIPALSNTVLWVSDF